MSAMNETLQRSDTTVPTGRDPPPCILDHLSFPHVFDAVLAAAPRSVLFQLRRLSHEIKARVDPIVFSHLVIDHRDARTEIMPYGLGDPAPWLAYNKSRDPCPSGAAVRIPVPIDYELVRFLDIVGPVPPTHLLSIFESLTDDLDTLRLRLVPTGRPQLSAQFLPVPLRYHPETRHVHPRAHTVVVFTEVEEAGPQHVRDQFLTMAPGVLLATRAERLVVNVIYEQAPWLDSAYYSIDVHPRIHSITEIVVHFTQRGELYSEPEDADRDMDIGTRTLERDGPPVVWDADEPGVRLTDIAEKVHGSPNPLLAGMLAPLLYQLWSERMLGRTKFTIVGLERLRPRWLGWYSHLTPDEMVSAFRDLVSSSPVLATLPEKPGLGYDAVTFVPRDEYRRTVGEEQWRIETAE